MYGPAVPRPNAPATCFRMETAGRLILCPNVAVCVIGLLEDEADSQQNSSIGGTSDTDQSWRPGSAYDAIQATRSSGGAIRTA